MSSATIPGVKEDVTEIVLNVKGIIAKLYSEGAKTVYIEASGECGSSPPATSRPTAR